MSSILRFVTYNIRKGKGASGRSTTAFSGLSHALAARSPDLVLVQEAFHCSRNTAAHSQDLAARLGMQAYYEPNKQRRVGHHGNATVTRYEVLESQNYDISTNRIERRGALYVRLRVGARPVHVLNVHLGLNHRQRVAQIQMLSRIVADRVPADEALIVAGDFNDWNQQIDRMIISELGMTNAFATGPGLLVRTWPARRPVFALDRVYLRHVRPRVAARLAGDPWSELSDHLPLWAELEVLGPPLP